MLKDTYIYPAIFTYDKDGISIEFPDLPGCLSCADNDIEAVHNAKDALSLYLHNMEEDNDEIPEPTQISKIKTEKNQVVFPIEVWMPYHRALIKTVSVKKTLTIPNWLNAIAEHNKINFSYVLQEALKERLGIKDK